MATVRKFCCNDLLRTSSVHLDYLAITTELSFYLTCLAKRRYIFLVAVAPRNQIIGYLIGKTEGKSEEEETESENWRGIAVNVNVASEYRRRGYGMRLMRLFEQLLVDKMLLSPRWPEVCQQGFHVAELEKNLKNDTKDCEYYTFANIDCENIPAINMFKQLGYEVTRTRKGFYLTINDEEQDSFEMRKKLSDEEPSVLQWPGYSQRKGWCLTTK